MEIVELWKQGKTVKEITALTGLSKHYIEKIVYVKHGLYRRGVKPETHPKKDRVLHLQKWGYQAHEIAYGEGINLNTVERILNGN